MLLCNLTAKSELPKVSKTLGFHFSVKFTHTSQNSKRSARNGNSERRRRRLQERLMKSDNVRLLKLPLSTVVLILTRRTALPHPAIQDLAPFSFLPSDINSPRSIPLPPLGLFPNNLCPTIMVARCTQTTHHTLPTGNRRRECTVSVSSTWRSAPTK